MAILSMRSVNFSVLIRKCSRRHQVAFLVLCVPVLVYCSLTVLPVRNVVFYGFTRYAWRDIPTYELLRIHYFPNVPEPDGMSNAVACDLIRSPKISRIDINTSAVLSYPDLRTEAALEKVLARHHGRYLPAFNQTLKLDHLYLYAVIAEKLNSAGVRHFLVSGSLLGVNRHGGMVPWDDDLDIAMHLDTWEMVKQSLSCLKGLVLTRFGTFHWKFHYMDMENPFVDMFFYQMDDDYVWALTSYIRSTFIYPTKYVFPLTWAKFEGLTVPVPKDGLSIVRKIYDFDTCVAYDGHVDTRNRTLAEMYPAAFTVSSLPCTNLSYIYSMHHLGGS